MAARAGRDSLASHISDVLSKKAASEVGDYEYTARSNVTGFTGVYTTLHAVDLAVLRIDQLVMRYS